jgi:hypothetical protein
MRRSAVRGICVAGALAFALSGTANAGVYGPYNTGAYARHAGSYSGFSGTVQLQSATWVGNNNISHPAQIAGSGNDFIGVGTYKGPLSALGQASCPGYTGSGWQGYMDGSFYGVYWCVPQGSPMSATARYTFKYEYPTDLCAYGGANMWQVDLSGRPQCMVASFSTARILQVGGESAAPTGYLPPIQKINVTYTYLRERNAGGTAWNLWTTATTKKDTGYDLSGAAYGFYFYMK